MDSPSGGFLTNSWLQMLSGQLRHDFLRVDLSDILGIVG